ncbi:multicopper oxidase family protein [Pseudorhodoplanes sp.]|uniref:multicopper oxidase family protein n=1 Tax=Pseudorhodoplanes sp. TaxID=1934341 RepID=UPI003D0D394E
MASQNSSILTRRDVLLGSAGLAAAALCRTPVSASEARLHEISLTCDRALVAMVGSPHPDTEVWCYNGAQPGPEIRVRQGDRLRVRVENRLPQETTVHWHGIRLPNAMDGVPHLTQKPISPGETYTYEFICPDAGTFWYHPHQRSFEQVGRGLYGALIVEEPEAPDVDRDVTWVLSDWRLLKNAAISDDFGNMHDVSHNGRVGNTVTVNGRVRDTFAVRAGERIRLRLINAANARIFGLEFAEHEPTVIALDGQPVEPHTPEGGRVVLGPAMRADIVLDMKASSGKRFTVADRFYRGLHYRLLDLLYSEAEPSSRVGERSPVRLAANPLAEPDLGAAERHQVVMGGGMMGGMRSAMMDGRETDIRTLMHNGLVWAINGIAAKGHAHEPLLSFARGRSYVVELVNDTAWHHPMHLHGHSFRVISRNGTPTPRREWQDTVLLEPRERTEIAFVADNPGDWMFHCHILEHQAGGMMGVFRVS